MKDEKLTIKYKVGDAEKVSSLVIVDGQNWLVKAVKEGRTSDGIGELLQPPTTPLKNPTSRGQERKPVGGTNTNTNTGNNSNPVVAVDSTVKFFIDNVHIKVGTQIDNAYAALQTADFATYDRFPVKFFRYLNSKNLVAVIVIQKKVNATIGSLLVVKKSGKLIFRYSLLIHQMAKIEFSAAFETYARYLVNIFNDKVAFLKLKSCLENLPVFKNSTEINLHKDYYASFMNGLHN